MASHLFPSRMSLPSAKGVPTIFLKAVIILIGIVALALCVFSFPHIWVGGHQELPQFAHLVTPGLIGIYATIIPFLFALYQAFKLLRLIDQSDAFSASAIRALHSIKLCAIAMTALYAVALPLAFVIAQLDDAPGLVLIATAFACSPLIVATFAAVLQKLVRSAVDMKTEHDLTI